MGDLNAKSVLENSPPARSTAFKKRVGYFLLSILLALVIVSGLAAVYNQRYHNFVYPGVYVGPYHLGGLSGGEVKNLIETVNNRLAKEGLNFVVQTTSSPVLINIENIGGNSEDPELIRLDSERLAGMALGVGREQGIFTNLYYPLALRLGLIDHGQLSAPFKIFQSEQLVAALTAKLSSFEDRPHNANIVVSNLTPLSYSLRAAQAGAMFDKRQIVGEMARHLSVLNLAPLTIAIQNFSPTILANDLGNIEQNLKAVIEYGDLSLNYIDPQTKVRRDWVITSAEWSRWLEAKRDNRQSIILGLNEESVRAYLGMVGGVINREPQDAKFIMTNGKVGEFKAGQSGVTLDTDATVKIFAQAFEERNYHPIEAVKTISVVIAIRESDVAMAAANNFGISDIIGVGTSTFYGSHPNRIKNIANAVAKLNGTLIKPDEVFSTTKYAGPFVLENGYLPELVIKGDRILKEVGGGMCQIGTTLFRMAMNCGMPIVERTNHSLVVNYYADPFNGNPGTDATIYDPILDLKFLNDTGNYLLLETKVDFKQQILTFTLWGKPDGRRGWYTHPIVSKWLAVPEPKEVVSGTMKPGEKECQAAYRGAVASFTYSRITPAGEQIDRVFDSYYRSLPKICLVGASSTPVLSPAPADSSSVNLDLPESALSSNTIQY